MLACAAPSGTAKSPIVKAVTEYLGPGDLALRWGYTKQGIQKLAKHEDFPRPVFTINRGRIRVWALADIELYENGRPELHSEAAKLSKVRGYLRASIKHGRQRN